MAPETAGPLKIEVSLSLVRAPDELPALVRAVRALARRGAGLEPGPPRPAPAEPPRNIAIRVGRAWYETHRQLTTGRAGSTPPGHVPPQWDDLDAGTRADWANVAAALLAQQVISAP